MGLVPPFCLDAVVAIGIHDSNDKFKGIASGFLYGDFQRELDEKGKEYGIYLISNRHVFKGLKQVFLRFNPEKIDAPAKDYDLSLLDEKGNPRWVGHPNSNIDVAAITINFPILRKEAMKCAYFQSDVHVAPIQKLKQIGIMEGDFIYTLGFPMGIVGETRNVVIARSGSIARIRDTLDKQNSDFLIDSFVFPGNIGGPVISKPEMTCIQGTKSQKASYLIGIVKSYVPYRDIAISEQTKNPRVIFEENSGLAVVHPTDFIIETISALKDQQK